MKNNLDTITNAKKSDESEKISELQKEINRLKADVVEKNKSASSGGNLTDVNGDTISNNNNLAAKNNIAHMNAVNAFSPDASGGGSGVVQSSGININQPKMTTNNKSSNSGLTLQLDSVPAEIKAMIENNGGNLDPVAFEKLINANPEMLLKYKDAGVINFKGESFQVVKTKDEKTGKEIILLTKIIKKDKGRAIASVPEIQKTAAEAKRDEEKERALIRKREMDKAMQNALGN